MFGSSLHVDLARVYHITVVRLHLSPVGRGIFPPSIFTDQCVDLLAINGAIHAKFEGRT